MIIESDKKEHGLFVKIYHDLLSFEKFKMNLEKIASFHSVISNKQLMKKFKVNNVDGKLSDKKFLMCKIQAKQDLKQLDIKRKRSEISFKQEPCGLHVACRTLKNAQQFLDKAKFTGWKKSGIIASNKRFIVECFSTEKLEFPIIKNGKILVDDNFLKLIVKKSNENLKRSWEN